MWPSWYIVYNHIISPTEFRLSDKHGCKCICDTGHITWMDCTKYVEMYMFCREWLFDRSMIQSRFQSSPSTNTNSSLVSSLAEHRCFFFTCFYPKTNVFNLFLVKWWYVTVPVAAVVLIIIVLLIIWKKVKGENIQRSNFNDQELLINLDLYSVQLFSFVFFRKENEDGRQQCEFNRTIIIGNQCF